MLCNALNLVYTNELDELVGMHLFSNESEQNSVRRCARSKHLPEFCLPCQYVCYGTPLPVEKAVLGSDWGVVEKAARNQAPCRKGCSGIRLRVEKAVRKSDRGS